MPTRTIRIEVICQTHARVRRERFNEPSECLFYDPAGNWESVMISRGWDCDRGAQRSKFSTIGDDYFFPFLVMLLLVDLLRLFGGVFAGEFLFPPSSSESFVFAADA